VLGGLFAVLAAATLAFNNVSVRRGVLTGTVAQAIFITVPIGVPIFFLIALAMGQLETTAQFSGDAIALLCLAGIIQFVWGRYCNYKSTEALGANLAGPVSELSLIVSLVLAISYLDEALTPLRLAGIVLTFAGPAVILQTRKRRADPHRVFEVDDRCKRLELDDDSLRTVLRGRFGLCDDHRNGLASEDDLLAGERFRGSIRPGGHERQISGRENRDDTRHSQRLVAVHGSNPRVCFRRENETRVQKSVHVPVGGELRRACHLVRSVDSRAGDSDEPLAHDSPLARSAASSSARRARTAASSRRYSAGTGRVRCSPGSSPA